jgi:hypothetical protein
MTLIRRLGHGLLAAQASRVTAKSVFMSQDLTRQSIDGSNMSCNAKDFSSNASASVSRCLCDGANSIMSVRCVKLG